jgi:outer membrane receptor protein involved in Fe transport
VRFRSILQRSVRAPNLTEAFQEQRIIANSFVRSDPRQDPCSASANPVANGNAERCILQGIPADQLGIYEATLQFPTNFIDGGNPDLVPETADTFTFGIILEPAWASKWQVAIDYFDLEVTDTIGDIDPAGICFDPANTANLFCENITRDPVSYNVTEVFGLTSNRGLSAVEGIDTQVSYATDLPGWMGIGGEYADLRVNLVWTHLLDKTVQANPASTPLDCTGRFGWPCDQDRTGETFPNDRVTTNFLYGSGQLTGNLTWRWISGSDNAAPLGLVQFGIIDPVLAIPSIGSTSYFDLGLGYDFTDNINARLNVTNLLDQDPPLMADAVFANNTDTSMYDIFGRAYQLSLFLRF